MIKEKVDCVCCGNNNLELIIDLGDQPPANSFRRIDEILPEFPLRLNLCKDCYHLQLSHALPPDLLFKNYLYVSGTSQTMLDYFQWMSEFVIEYCSPLTVLDVACNDGSQLDYFQDMGCDTYGIDPAENLFEISHRKGHKIVCNYFNQSSYVGKTFDSILAQNVFGHVESPLEFLLSCKEIMHDDSYLFIQTSQANMILENQFDTIYHEHISFFNINSMNELVKRSGLHLIDVIKTPIHGISYLFILNKQPSNKKRIENLIEVERYQGLYDSNTYLKYRNNIQTICAEFINTTLDFVNAGYLLVGYGAAAKGMTFLNTCNVNPDVIIDDNPMKQGLFCPGFDTEIVSVDWLSQRQVKDCKILFIPLAWNYFDEIKQRIQLVRNNKEDKFLKYFPNVRVE